MDENTAEADRQDGHHDFDEEMVGPLIDDAQDDATTDPKDTLADKTNTSKVSLDDYKRYKDLFGPKLLSEADRLKAKETIRRLLPIAYQDEIMEKEPTIEMTLQLLKTNLADARAAQEKLCYDGGALVSQRRRLQQTPAHEFIEAERAITSLVDDNSLKLAQVEREVADTEARIKSLESARKASLESNSMHVTVKRIFRFNLIPVLADGVSIDWDRTCHDSHAGAPTLNLTAAASKAKDSSTLALYTAQAITSFLETFRTFYRGKLVELFDFLAWRYMEAALKPSNLDEEFKASIEMHTVGTRSWELVSEYVIKITNLDGFRHLVKSRLFTLRVELGESALAFVTRIKYLVRAAKADDMGHHLSELIFHALPLQGQDEILKTYPKGPSTISDYTVLLRLIGTNRSLVTGDLADPLEYVSKRWAKHLVTTTTRKRPFSSSMAAGQTSTNNPAAAASTQATVPSRNTAVNADCYTRINLKNPHSITRNTKRLQSPFA